MNFRALVSFALARVCFASNTTKYTVNFAITGLPENVTSPFIVGPLTGSWVDPNFFECKGGMCSLEVIGGTTYEYKMFETNGWDKGETGWWSIPKFCTSAGQNKVTPVINSNVTFTSAWGECPYVGAWDGNYYSVSVDVLDRGTSVIGVRGPFEGNNWAPSDSDKAKWELPLKLELPGGVPFQFKFVNQTAADAWESMGGQPCAVGNDANREMTLTSNSDWVFQGLGSCNVTKADITGPTEPPECPDQEGNAQWTACMAHLAAPVNCTRATECWEAFVEGLVAEQNCVPSEANQMAGGMAFEAVCGNETETTTAAGNATTTTTTKKPQDTNGASVLAASWAVLAVIAANLA